MVSPHRLGKKAWPPGKLGAAAITLLATLASACSEAPVELPGELGVARHALCEADDVGCQAGAPPWPRWSDQPDRKDPKYVEIDNPLEEELPDAGSPWGEPTWSVERVDCNPDLLGKLPVNPNPKGADLQNISTNFHFLQSLQMIASVVTKAASKLNEFESQATDSDFKGDCICQPDLSCFPPKSPQKSDITKEECLAYCDPNRDEPTECSAGYLVWLANDFQKSDTGKAKWALDTIKWLDRLSEQIGDGSFAEALSAIGGELDNIDELVSRFQCRVDQLTEGYHLGSYSEQRPHLHSCVPYAGHGAYASFGDGGNSRWGIGARYTSHNLSKTHRAQMRTGGFAVTAFGHELSILPGFEFNLQIDGYKWFNRKAPLGIEALGALGHGGIAIEDAKKMGLFNVVDESQLKSLDSDDDGRISQQEFLIATYTPFKYEADGHTSPVTWPRDLAVGVDDWEGKSAALMAYALNTEFRLKPIERELAKIPVFPGATLKPYFRLEASSKWYDEAYRLRTRLQEAINKHATVKLDTADFDRNMHPFQAPDVTAEAGTEIHVKPEIGAKLLFGAELGKRLKVGVEAHLGFSVDLAPRGAGGVVDMSTALEQALVHSNPQGDLECKPTFAYKDVGYCSSKYMDESGTNYLCTKLDARSSCCLTFFEGTDLEARACIDDWTGFTKAMCDKEKLSKDVLEAFLGKGIVRDQLQNLTSDNITAKWTDNKSCADCEADGSCTNSVKTPNLPTMSECERRGYCCQQVVVTLFGDDAGAGQAGGGGTASQDMFTGYLRDLEMDDANRKLYVVDENAIRVIDLVTNQVTTLAGDDSSGYVDGSAALARFDNIEGLALDGAGNLLVSDRYNNAIRKINLTTHQVTTLTKGDPMRFSPRGIDIIGGFLYVANGWGVERIDLATGAMSTVAGAYASGNVDGVGAQVRFAQVYDLVADGQGRLILADLSNHTLRLLDPSSRAVTTVAGSGAAGMADGIGRAAIMDGPHKLALDPQGVVSFSHFGSHRNYLRTFNPKTLEVATVAGQATNGIEDGPLGDAKFGLPMGRAFASDGTLYVGDLGRIRVVTTGCDRSVPGAITYDVTDAECPGDFHAYSCFIETESEVTGWVGPGCHPLHAGFQSACGCTSNLDCGSGETCDPDKNICMKSGAPVECLCNPSLGNTACDGSGRTCADGACARTCRYTVDTADTACGPNQACAPEGVCVPKGGVQYAEQILWGARDPEVVPKHAIATYGLSEIELIAALNAGINIGLEFKLFKKWRKFTLFNWRDAWDLGSVEKAWFQPGLEATYHWDSSPAGLVTNYQPDQVTRYPEITSHYDQTSELLAWCEDAMPKDVVNPFVMRTEDLTSSIQDVINFGFNVGESVYDAENLCIQGRPMLEWLQDEEALKSVFGAGMCRYVGLATGNYGNDAFSCGRAPVELLKHWGCLDINLSHASHEFASSQLANVVTYDTNPGTFNLAAIMIDPEGGLEPSNLTVQGPYIEAWLADVEACFDDRFGETVDCSCQVDEDCATGPGQTCQDGVCINPDASVAQCSVIQSDSIQPERCCGDGLQQGDEQCDDGNVQDGDGCSSLCRSESTAACCLPGACRDTNGQGASECAAQGGYLVSGTTCDALNHCGRDRVGSCELNGECRAPSYESQCAAAHGRFIEGGTCRPPQEHVLTLQPGPDDGNDANLVSSSAARGTPHPSVPLSAGAWTSGPEYFVRGLVGFDLSSIPQNATVIDARLSLYADTQTPLYGQGRFNSEKPGHSTLSGSNEFYLRRITTPWKEDSITWNFAPGYSHAQVVPRSTSPSQDYPNIDVTALVRDMVRDPDHSFGFMIQLVNERRYREVTFTSSEYQDPSRRPKLVIRYKTP